jgi:DNA polymerase III subunit delta'
MAKRSKADEEADGQDVPGPRFTAELIGHAGAETAFAEAYESGRLPHAWLICGPKGIGKATLAFRFARFLFSKGAGAGAGPGLFGPAPASGGMAMSPDDPIFRRVASGGHADLKVVERSVNPDTGKLRSEIVVDDVRALGEFLRLTPAEGGYRVVIVDAADEMNRNAANAVLKALEEPPSRSVLLLVSHSPGRLLPTIRSRCRKLMLSPLDDSQVTAALARLRPELDGEERAAAARLAGGSIGRAIEIADAGGGEIYGELVSVLAKLPKLDMSALQRFASEAISGGIELPADLLRLWHARFVAGAATGKWPPELAEGEAATFRRLAQGAQLDRWFEVWEKNDRLFKRADSLNLDHRQVLLNAFLALESAARA